MHIAATCNDMDYLLTSVSMSSDMTDHALPLPLTCHMLSNSAHVTSQLSPRRISRPRGTISTCQPGNTPCSTCLALHVIPVVAEQLQDSVHMLHMPSGPAHSVPCVRLWNAKRRRHNAFAKLAIADEEVDVAAGRQPKDQMNICRLSCMQAHMKLTMFLFDT